MTPCMKQALDAIRRLTVDGVSPTYRDLQAELGLASVSGVHRLVHSLIRAGALRQPGHGYRSIEIVEGPTRDQMENWSDAEIRRVALVLYEIGRERGVNRLMVFENKSVAA